MSKIRNRLESYVVRNTSDLVDDLNDERRTELAELLHELEGHSPRAAEAESRTEELVEKLDHRNAVIEKSRARIEELEEAIAKANTELGDSEQRINEQMESERIRTAEREQNLRAELTAKKRELELKAESLTMREQAILETDRTFFEREHAVATHERQNAELKARLEFKELDLESRTDERLMARERELARRATDLAQAEQLMATEKQSLERRAVHLAELEQQLERRQEERAEENPRSSRWPYRHS